LRFNQITLENCPRGSTKDIKLLKTLAAWPNKWKPQRYVRTHNPKRQRGRSETEAQKWAEKGNHRKSECGKKKKKLEIEKQKPTGTLFSVNTLSQKSTNIKNFVAREAAFQFFSALKVFWGENPSATATIKHQQPVSGKSGKAGKQE